MDGLMREEADRQMVSVCWAVGEFDRRMDAFAFYFGQL